MPITVEKNIQNKSQLHLTKLTLNLYSIETSKRRISKLKSLFLALREISKKLEKERWRNKIKLLGSKISKTTASLKLKVSVKVVVTTAFKKRSRWRRRKLKKLKTSFWNLNLSKIILLMLNYFKILILQTKTTLSISLFQAWAWLHCHLIKTRLKWSFERLFRQETSALVLPHHPTGSFSRSGPTSTRR